MTQVYLPYQNFGKVAKCLDNRRLNKQIVEATQVYTQNKYGFGGQGNLAPYKMWKGYENCLAFYIVILYQEWQLRLIRGERGGKLQHKSGEYILNDKTIDLSDDLEYPNWFNDQEIYSSHRSALLYKNYEHYSRFGWTEKPAVPVKIDKKGNVTLPYVYGIGK